MVISRKYVGITDPHSGLQVVPEGGAGIQIKLADFLKHKSHAECFTGVFEMSAHTTDYRATLFRFPLRGNVSESKVSKNCYTPEKVHDNLFASLQEEAPILLLFLRNVIKVSMFKWNEATSSPDCIFKIEINGRIAHNREGCTRLAESYNPTSSKTGIIISSVNTVTWKPLAPQSRVHHWLVMNAIGSDCEELRERAQKTCVLPWVGIAAPTPTDLDMQAIKFDVDGISSGSASFRAPLSKLSHIQKISFEGVESNERATGIYGRAFCFLPLPGSISLPVNLHGYFAVADNRRSIKWPSHDEKGEEAEWNKMLLLKLVSPLYALMLACRSTAVEYIGPTCDAYAAWPVYAEVKNQQIWSHILNPVLDQLIDLPILWAGSQNGGKWVTFQQASFITENDSLPSIALRELANARHSIVHLSHNILETMLSNKEMEHIITQRYIKPNMVREALRNNKGIVSLYKQEEAYELLRYILNDKPDLTSLWDLEVFPLNSSCRFSALNGKQLVFLFTEKEKDALKFLPGISSYIIDVKIPLDLQVKLEELAQNDQTTLTLVTTNIICSHLLTLSMKSWYPNLNAQRECLWEPGQSAHPPLEWIHDIWVWIQTHNAVERILDIPLVPTEVVSMSTKQVTLVSLNTSPELCTLPTNNLPCSKDELLSIVREMGLTHIPRSECVFNCPGIMQYIKPISAHFLLKNVGKLQSLSLSDSARDCLREYISIDLLSSQLTREEVDAITSLKIFKAGVGGSDQCYVSLNKTQFILPPHGLLFSQDIQYPLNILHDDDRRVIALLEKLHVPRSESIDEFCKTVILPHVASESQLGNNEEQLIMWVLQCPLSRPKFLADFSIIRPCTSDILRKPTELYDPEEKHFCTLYDKERDPVFPDSAYNSVLHVLRQAGLITWSNVISEHKNMIAFLTNRAQSISLLSKSEGLERSKYLLQLLLNHNIIAHFARIPFVFSQQVPPDNYPSSLWWCGKNCHKILCPQDVCITESDALVVGSVVPVASSEYKLRERYAGFHCISPEEIVCHFHKVVQYKPSTEIDLEKVHNIIMKIYHSLMNATGIGNLPDAWIWWRSRNEFLRPDQCVFSLPTGIGSLEPFLFNISLNGDLQMCVKALLPKLSIEIQESVTGEQAIAVLQKMKIKQVQRKEMPSEDIQMCIRILNWLKSLGPHTYGDMLVPTSLKILASVSECTYDDRSWNTKVRKSKYTFVHQDVSPALAKHFGVVPLSRKVAPSQNLKLKYTKAGQKEPVTRRIKRIVEDYATGSDIFKELLQNADDAQATEVKFLIDWREHPKLSLFTDELASWQGPALIAYNNATFSDQDFEHICELAGETKMKDPLKTGRFGVGFCATYGLTDVPSFISRRFFTMFDPHTTYLGDRVSAGEPGMRVDLVENKEDLAVYEDQFKPFNGLFGCNVFDLFEDGFKGTIFRFPFRTYDTANKSNICQDVIDEDCVKKLIEALKNQASYLLLFLKHVQKVSVFVLNKGEVNVSSMEQKVEIFRNCSCSQGCNRLSLLDPCLHMLTNICHCTIGCKMQEGKEPYKNFHSVLCSVVCPSKKQENERGLIPFAEVAIPVRKDKKGMLSPVSVEGYTFCFLPLPKKTGLPFHINGFFEIGRDRSDLKTTDDGRFGKDWNDFLCSEPLTHAFITALSGLARMSPIFKMSKEHREKYLESYYNLFMPPKNTGLSSLHLSLKEKLPESEELLIWSDVERGKWLKPKDIEILDFSHSVQKMIEPATAVLLYLKHTVCKVPHLVKSFLIQYLKQRLEKQVFTCQDFYTKVFLPSLNCIPNDIRNEHIIFLLGSLDQQKWIKPALEKFKFVPVEGCSKLVHPKEVIDAQKRFMKSLFDVEDERFPQQFIQKSQLLMLSLKQLGMPTELSVEEIKQRACTVTEKERALNRAWTIISYIQSIHYSVYSNQTLSNAIGDVCFLPVDCKPQNCQIPWCKTKSGFVQPKDVFVPVWNNLVFSVCPVVNPPEEYKIDPDIFVVIGASKEPPLDLVLDHLITLSESFDEEANTYVSKAVKEIYEFLSSKWRFNKEDLVEVRKRIGQKGFILQGNKFLRADQVVMVWNKDCYPYLCALSSENHNFKDLFSLLGVQEQPSAESLAQILRNIASKTKADTGEVGEAEVQVSMNIIDFIEEVVKKLSSLVEIGKSERPKDLFLPDECRVMRPVERLACDKVSDDWVQSLDLFASQSEGGKLHFLNENIPRKRAIKLGVMPLLDTLLQGLEDNDFMKGMDYGQHEDLCDRLRSILCKYPSDHSILNEFVQNADDARATEIVFIIDHRKFPSDKLFPSRHQNWKDLQETPALLIVNNSKFIEKDIKGIAKLGRGGKKSSADTIGRFGIGFNVAYHVTDCPSFVTFSEYGEAENFCVFDPTCRFANTTKQHPGKRWKISSKIVTDLSDQFQPYLLKGIETPLIENLDKEHVVFRLPLTPRHVSPSESLWYRTSPTPYRTHQQISHNNQEKQASFGNIFTSSKLQQLFTDMEFYARETPLFLNNIQKISAVEIAEDGKVFNHFHTRLITSSDVQTECTKFANTAKEIMERTRETEQLSLIYEMEILHNKALEDLECQKWLICKQFSPVNMVQHDEEGLEDPRSDIEWNMRPIGGIAAALGTVQIKGHLFCFLPMPLESMLPVHVNGHFLVDDSRKHLEKKKKESTDWNISLANNVLAPCYVDMLLYAQKMTQNGEAGEEWFYKLFPSLNNEGEVANLKLPEHVYKILYQRNPPILLQKCPDTGSKKWLTLNGENMGCFFRPFLSEETHQFVVADPDLRFSLIRLGMPVVTGEVPLTLYNNLSTLYKQAVAYVTPELIIDHMKNRAQMKRMKEVLTVKNMQLLLQFITDARKARFVKESLSSVPLLLTLNSNLWSGKTIFKSKFASLLPHCQDHFILPELEESPVGQLLANATYGVIVDLTVEFVRENIGLLNTKQPVKIKTFSSDELELLKTFWLYMKSLIYGGIKEIVVTHFLYKPLLPADDGNLYPMSLSSTVLCSEMEWADTNLRNALNKLGYPTISFQAIKISEVIGLVNNGLNAMAVIDCFNLKAPPTEDADLSDSEVRCIIESVRAHNDLQLVSSILLRLKLFKTVGGVFMSMKGNPQVFVMPHDVPRGGIKSIQEYCEDNFVLLDATDSFTMEFYKKILTNIGNEKVSLYRKVILPHLHHLHVDFIQNHLTHIMCNKDLLRPLRQDLKNIKFIKLPNGEVCTVRDVCHPHNTFFIAFCSSRLLPGPWQIEIEKWLTLFKDLGFRHEVTNEDWISHSRQFSVQSSILSGDAAADKSAILLSTFIEKFGKNHFSPTELITISEIPFIYNRDPEPALFQEINMLFKTKHPISKKPLCFKGSVFSSKSHLAALCKTILPSCCDCLERNLSQCSSLGIENPVSAQTIVCNLKELSTCYTCVQMCRNQVKNTNKLRGILRQHFKELNGYHADLSELKETLCVPVSVPGSLTQLTLVKPSQIITSIPSGINFEPFFYQVPHEIAGYHNLLDALGVSNEICAHHCVHVLHNIYKQLTQVKQYLSSQNKFKEIALGSYNQLVCVLRKEPCECLSEELFLPSEDDELLPRDELVFNDAPWYAQRLQKGDKLKFLKLPPPDANGEKIPPGALGVKKLTSLVCEELHPDMELEAWACNEELHYARDRSKPRCNVVDNILQTLQSKQLKDGLLRVYYSERQERPPQQFEQTIQRLETVEISCVTSNGVHTVLKRDGIKIANSESRDKLCFALVSTERLRLVLAPHNNDFNEVSFIQQLSKAVNIVLDKVIKNEAHIASMLKCTPEEIEGELDKEQVVCYDPNSIKETKYLQAGEEISLDHLTIADCLLVLNFTIGDIVRYYVQRTNSMVTAKVVQIKNSSSYKDNLVTLSLKERGSADDEDCTNVDVSPACIFKIMTPSQQIVLFPTSSVESEVKATAEPVVFAPISDKAEDIASVLESNFFKGVSREMAMTRLMAHVYYGTGKQFNAKVGQLVGQFVRRLHSFLEAEDPLQPFVNYILSIIQNDLQVPPPACKNFPSVIEGSAISYDHIPMASAQWVDISSSANPCYHGGHGNTTVYNSGAVGAPPMVPQHTTQSQGQYYSRFQPPLRRRTGQRSYYRPQRYRFQQQTQPPPPLTSERHAHMWLDQAKMDYRAAMFLMRQTKLNPVIVAPPESCVTAQSTLEPLSGEEIITEATESLISETAEIHSSHSLQMEHLDEDKPNSAVFAADENTLEPEAPKARDERQPLLKSSSSVSVISSLHSEHEEDNVMEPNTTNFPSVVCFLCHEAVEKSIKGVMYAYCGVSSELINCSSLITLLQQLKVSRNFPRHLLSHIEKCAMQVSEHQNQSRYPNFQIPPCAPAAIYTNANAREALMATGQLLNTLTKEHNIAPILKGLNELPVPQFTSMLRSLDGMDDGK